MKKIILLFLIVCSFTSLFSQTDTSLYSKPADTAKMQTLPETAPADKKEEPKKVKDKKTPKKNQTPLMKRIYFGGSFGATFGTYSSIRINPIIGYKITPKLSAGVKFYYEHVRSKYFGSTYSADNYGGSLFSRFRIIKALYLHAEYAMISYESYYLSGGETYSERDLVPFLFLGAGYSRKLVGNSWLNIQVLFDVLQNSKSPYRRGEPFYSVGVGVGF